MSDGTNVFGGYDNDSQTVDQKPETGSGLRAKLEEALTRAKAAEDKAAQAEKDLKARTTADLFRKFEVPDKVLKFYNGDATEEAVTEWLKENAEIFGVSLPGSQVTESPDDKTRNDALRETQAASKLGFDGNSHAIETALGEANAKLASGASEAELDDVINKMFGKRK